MSEGRRKKKVVHSRPAGKRKRIAKRTGILLLCLLFPALAAWRDMHPDQTAEGGLIERPEAGEMEEEVTMTLNASGLPEDYSYSFSVEAVLYTEEEICLLMEQAKREIDQTFYREGESADHVTVQVFPEDSYAGGSISAEWTFGDYGKISSEGVLKEEELTEEGCLISVEVELSCQEMSEEYCFAIRTFPVEQSQSEKLLASISKAIAEEGKKVGEHYLKLPETVDGVTLNWSEEKEYLFVKVLLFELVILALLYLERESNRRQERERYRTGLCMDYPEIVSKLSILMGAGMSLRMAWRTIAERYAADQKKEKKARPAYELMLRAWNLMQSGETELRAYQLFGVWAGEYRFHRLSRLLVQNLEKGNKDLCACLQKEAEEAFEERKLLARKRGEEASTRMLLPLMLMMGIVIAIVIAPAIISFN